MRKTTKVKLTGRVLGDRLGIRMMSSFLMIDGCHASEVGPTLVFCLKTKLSSSSARSKYTAAKKFPFSNIN